MLKKVLLLTCSIVAVVGLGFFYTSWYDYEKAGANQQISSGPFSTADVTPVQEKIYVEKFDPNEQTSVQSTTNILQGSYSVEGDSGDRYVWVKQNSKILLKNVADKSIVVKGYVPYSSHQKASQVTNFTVDFLINGKVVNTLTIKEDKIFEQTIPFNSIANVMKGNECELEIITSNQFIPTNVGLGSDNRELSMMIKYIGIN